ncbi:unnamed protein product [Orchesella dallaii]|uniref:Uncharacterized protein n=1 Tax=Orchesella dallaii TaxID=48710 RepID=A0ABP1S6N2_9HEXA
MKSLKGEVKHLKHELVNAKRDNEKVLYIANKQNLVLSGISEENDTDLKMKVTRIIRERLEINVQIDTADRLGPPSNPAKARLVKVRLQSMADRKEILTNKKKLIDIYVNEDLPPGMRTTQYTLRLALKKAKEEKRNIEKVNWHQGTVEVDGVSFYIEEGKLVPEQRI